MSSVSENMVGMAREISNITRIKSIKNVTRCREQISKKHRNKVGMIA